MPDSQNASWSSLFVAASAFRELGPWEWMSDNQVFGVEDPVTGEVAWCAVLGMRGEVFGLAAYLGAAGLDIHRGIQSGKLGSNSDKIRFGFPCLLTTFENRQELEASDLSLIRSLGLTFRGRNEWPQFRSYRRGWYPWHLDGAEVVFLADVIEQAVVVCARIRSEPGLVEPATDSERFVRAIGKSGSWGDTWMRLARPVAVQYPASNVDEQEAAGLSGTVSSREGIWEVDLFYVPTPTRENRDERPYYPVAMVWADQRSGMVLGMDLLSQADDPDQKVAALAEKLLALAREHSRIPQAIHVPRPAMAAALSRAAELLGCELVVSKRLPALKEVKDHLLARFAGP